MEELLVRMTKVVAYSASAAVGVLLVGGAVKKVFEDPADDCIEKGKELAGSLLEKVGTRPARRRRPVVTAGAGGQAVGRPAGPDGGRGVRPTLRPA